MAPASGYQTPLDRLADRIAHAAAPSSGLVDDIAATLPRLAALRLAGKTGHFDACRNSGAWVDVALALIAHELPGWSVRRLVRDDDVWFCSLSRSPNLPVEFDDAVEASHVSMPLAILLAFTQAKHCAASAKRVPSTGAHLPASAVYRMSCDNFA